jgi:chromosome segregation ATPase
MSEISIETIENMSASELKERQSELAQFLEDTVSIPVLVGRYLHARLDAKLRDEKLAEQGEAITALQAGVEHWKSDACKMDTELGAARTEVVNLQAELERAVALQESTQEALAAEKARADRLKTEALRNRKALQEAAGIVNGAIHAQVVDDADTGV